MSEAGAIAVVQPREQLLKLLEGARDPVEQLDHVAVAPLLHAIEEDRTGIF